MKAVRFCGPNVQGLPLEWPAEVREITIHADAPDGFVVFDDTELETHISNHRPAYEAWRALQDAAQLAIEAPARIRSEAERRIYALMGMPDVNESDDSFRRRMDKKQSNMNARSSEILLAIIQQAATDADLVELGAMRSFFEKVKAIRAFSNNLEAAWASGERPDMYAGWPH
jgi:hypothetical protein